MDDYDEEDFSLFTDEELIQLRIDQGPPELYPKYSVEGVLVCLN